MTSPAAALSESPEAALFDVVIVGGGAAGLSAALVLGRARRSVAVVDSGSPRNAPAAHMHGFLSREGLPPAELLLIGRDEVRGYGVTLVEGAVAAARPDVGGFRLSLDDGRELLASRVVVATGLRDELPDVPGLRERWGVDVLHCPYCHGYEVRDEPLAVLGGPDTATTMHQTLLVRQWSADLVLFSGGLVLTAEDRSRLAARGVRVIEEAVSRVVSDDGGLRAVELADGRSVERSAVFVPPRFVPRDEVLRSLGCAVGENGFVTTDPTGATSVAGVWAAGNVVDPRAQVISAAGAGSVAAVMVNASLVERDVEDALGSDLA